MQFHLRSSAFICGSLLFLAGCAGDVTKTAQYSSLDSFDLQRMTDDMARQIAADPDVIGAFDARGPLKVVVRPVENRLTGEVLPRGEAELFTARVRSLLAQHAPDKFTWIMNRDAFYRLRGRELESVDLGPAPEAVDPQYALTATFSSLTNEDARRRSAYYLCVYELTDLAGRTTLWSGKYEVKKLVVKSDLD